MTTPNLAELQQRLTDSPSYRLAYQDEDFLVSDVARSARLQLELHKPDWYLQHHNIASTVIVFGSARFLPRDAATEKLQTARDFAATHVSDTAAQKKLAAAETAFMMSEYYEQARAFGYLVSQENQNVQHLERGQPLEHVICTGGGPGIMEAANRGAFEANALSVGLNIRLPFEQYPNPYISPQLCFQFHYFAIRKIHFLLRAKALVACPGGFGTFDELFEALTLRQTNKTKPIPIILFGGDFWRRCVDFNYLVETEVISPEDLELMYFTEEPRDAWEHIQRFHTRVG